MLLQDSAQRQRDQQNTVFILSLPVVIAVVPAGSLPSALPPDQTPRQCRTFSAQKCKQAAESCTLCCTGRHEGDITEESNIYYCFRFGYQDGYCVTIKQKLYCTYIYTRVKICLYSYCIFLSTIIHIGGKILKEQDSYKINE